MDFLNAMSTRGRVLQRVTLGCRLQPNRCHPSGYQAWKGITNHPGCGSFQPHAYSGAYRLLYYEIVKLRVRFFDWTKYVSVYVEWSMQKSSRALRGSWTWFGPWDCSMELFTGVSLRFKLMGFKMVLLKKVMRRINHFRNDKILETTSSLQVPEQ